MENNLSNSREHRQHKYTQINQIPANIWDNEPLSAEVVSGHVNGLLNSDGLNQYDQYRITDKTDIPEPVPFLKIAGETITAIGDIAGISGPPKSGKSAVLNMGIASSLTLTGTIPDGIDGQEVKPNVDIGAVIHADTEQAKHKHQANIRSILKRSGLKTCPPNFLSYNIRELPLKDYKEITAGICREAFKEFGSIHSIWIDGGADYIAGVNDEITANDVIKFFSDLATQYNTAVFIVVHTNPGGEKERGHFGSQLQRKVGAILNVKEDPATDSSYIEPKFLRYAGKKEIPSLAFKYDKDKGYHVGIGKRENPNSDEAKRKALIQKSRSIANEVFSNLKSLSYSEAIEAIEIYTTQSGNTSKKYFKFMNSENMIIQGVDKNWRLNNEYV